MRQIRLISNVAGWPHSDVGNGTDEVLVANAKLGDENAFTELWRRHSKVARRILLRITGNPEDAEDALQEALMKSFVHMKSFDGRSKFSTWLIRIATNTALAELRRKRRRPEVLFSAGADAFLDALGVLRDDSVDIEARLVLRKQAELLEAAVESLPPSLRCVIELWRKREYSIEQIAEVTGLSISATKTRLYRARCALRVLAMQTDIYRRKFEAA
jgi:RNA polymerase sigma factor (sigma-70 family)